jgi:hypothetical protein
MVDPLLEEDSSLHVVARCRVFTRPGAITPRPERRDYTALSAAKSRRPNKAVKAVLAA